MSDVRLLADVRNVIGESPVWLDETRTLYWVDAQAGQVFWRGAEDGAVGSRSLSVPVTAIIPRASGGWILITKDGLCSASSDFTAVLPIMDPTAADPRTCLNDGVADSWGRVWTGSQSRSQPDEPIGRLYCVSPAAGSVEVDDGFANANGLALSPDGSRVYVSDMFHRRIRLYDLDPESGLVMAKPDPFPTEGPGYPDGLAVDNEGLLWVAYWDGARVERLDGRGRVVATVTIPADLATRACLGGVSRSQLFVTSGRYLLDDVRLGEQPLAGALFVADVAAQGLVPARARL